MTPNRLTDRNQAADSPKLEAQQPKSLPVRALIGKSPTGLWTRQ